MKKFFKEFKEFLAQGNILDMAVAFVMGTAFKAIVTSLVDNIIMPLVGILIGKNFTELTFTINGAVISYGVFIQNIVDFLIIAFCLFMVIKVLAMLKNIRKAEEEAKEEEAAPEKSDETKLLEEIRDLLKDKNNG